LPLEWGSTQMFLSLGATVGFQNNFYRISEDTGYIEICAVIIRPMIIEPIEFQFEVEFAAINVTASKYITIHNIC